MDKTDIDTLLHSDDFRALLKARRSLALPIVTIMITFYFGFISLVAFRPDLLGRTIGNGHVSIGIYAGLGLLLLSFFLTSLYLRLSDRKIAALQLKIQDKFK